MSIKNKTLPPGFTKQTSACKRFVYVIYKFRHEGRRIGLRVGDSRDRDLSLNKLAKFKREIDSMESDYRFGTPVSEDQLELRYDDKLLGKLIDLGLVVKPTLSIGGLIEDINPHWLPNVGEIRRYDIGLACRYLLEFFGAGMKVDKIKFLDVAKYILHRKALGKSESTIKKDVLVGKKLFDLGIKYELARFNPFIGHVLSSKAKKSAREIDSSILWKVEQNIDDAWKPMFMLTRYTGCRPSEGRVLLWEDVDFGKRMIKMPNDKTALKTNRDFRYVPMFDELYDYLFELYQHAVGEYVISYKGLSGLTRTQRKHASWYTPFMSAVRRCGVEAWSNPFRRLRSNRENELLREGKLSRDQILYLMGHTKEVSDAHYKSEVSSDEMREALGFNCAGHERTSWCTTGENRKGADSDLKVTAMSKNPVQVPASLCKPIYELGLSVSYQQMPTTG